jgi:predicted nucleic acid-binding protein
MQTIMFDTNEFDKLAAARDAYERLLALLSEGKIELLTTHIQRDEILAIENTTKKARLLALLSRARMIPTRGIVVGVSRYGQSRYGSDEDHKLIEHIRGERWDRDTNDALIAATAARDAEVFVTDDATLMRRLNSYSNIRCEVIDFKEFERRLINA